MPAICVKDDKPVVRELVVVVLVLRSSSAIGVSGGSTVARGIGGTSN